MTIHFLRRTARVMFSYLYVSLFIWLLATLRKKGGTDFHEIFRIGGTGCEEQSWKLGVGWGCYVYPFRYRVNFCRFSYKSVSVSNITRKRMNGCSRIFNKSGTWAKQQSGIFSGCCGSPLESRIDSFYFLDSCFLVTLWKKRVKGFSWFF